MNENGDTTSSRVNVEMGAVFQLQNWSISFRQAPHTTGNKTWDQSLEGLKAE